MSTLDYDPEATVQSADLEMYELERVGRLASRLRQRGICTHGSTLGRSATGEVFYDEQRDLRPGEVLCRDCGKKWPSDDDLYGEIAELLGL